MWDIVFVVVVGKSCKNIKLKKHRFFCFKHFSKGDKTSGQENGQNSVRVNCNGVGR
jgi:hypothetical protein